MHSRCRQHPKIGEGLAKAKWTRELQRIRLFYAKISLQKKVIALLLLFIACLDIMAMRAIGNWFSEREQTSLEQHLDLLLKVQGNSLITPLWELDTQEVQRLINLIGESALVTHAAVRDSYASANGETEVIARYGLEPIDDPLAITREFSINEPDSGEPVGVLSVSFSGQPLLESLAQIELMLFCGGIIALLALAALVIACFDVLLRPIRQMTEAMLRLADNDLDIVIPATERHDEIGKMAQALVVFKTNAVQLKTSLDKERELNGLQRQFVSMVSHEFRTPLAIIDGIAQSILRRLDRLKPNALKKSQQKVRLSVTRLTELMESVLSAARLEEGRIAFQPEPCPLVDLITEIHGSYSELNQEKEIILGIDRLPNMIIADGKLLRQVVSNLLSNAIKYSPEGKRVWITGNLNEQNELTIAVRDEGIGIPEAELEKLCDRFFRASTSIGIAGSGIGLSLVKHFVELHGGRIDMDSVAGVGSTFTVLLPFNDPAAETIEYAA